LLADDRVVVEGIEKTTYRAARRTGAVKRENQSMNASDTAKVQRYLRQRFGNHKLTIARRENKNDSAELMLEDEFLGVIFEDTEDGETCYHVQMTILPEDLED
jgi:hypothetical protein